MVARAFLTRAEPGFTLPTFQRLAPPPPPELIAGRLEANSSPGDIVADLQGRGGWVARAAVDRQRRAVTIESSPLTRLLAEVVLRPPDIRHLDAAFGGLSASPRGESSLKLSIGATFATRCATCERPSVADEFIWHDGDAPSASPALARKNYRCTVCRDQQGGGEARHAPVDDADQERATADVGATSVRRRLRERFPVPDGGTAIVDQLLDLHTDRQLVGLAANLDRIEGDLRAPTVEAALRLAFLQSILPASRLNSFPGRVGGVRISGGRVKHPAGEQWRERNPWLAFEDGFRIVRAFVQRLEAGQLGAVQARFGSDLGSLGEGAASVVVRLATPSGLRSLAAEAGEMPRASRQKIRLVLGQTPMRFNQERLAGAYHATAWTLGREAAALLPIDALVGSAIRSPWSWQAAALRRLLEAIEPHVARDGRAIFLLEAGGPEALVAAAVGGASAGFRLVSARLAEAEEELGGIVEFVPPGATLPPGPRSRANRPLEATPGGAGDPDIVPGRGLFAAPERYDARPFSAADAARSITDTAVEVLKARGEPAGFDRLLGEILVSLDRNWQLRRLVAFEPRRHAGTDGGSDDEAIEPELLGPEARLRGGDPPSLTGRLSPRGEGPIRGETPGPSGDHLLPARGSRSSVEAEPDLSADPVDRLVALVRDELARPNQRRLVEVEPGRWWLADREDQAAVAAPLADRVEWAVFSLLSTAGPLSEPAFFDRIAGLFRGHDLPDEALVRSCLESYRSLASTPDRLVTGEDLRRRTHEHTEMLALIANGGHRLGLEVALGAREQGRRLGDRFLGDWLDERERRAYLPLINHAPIEDLEAVDAIWYVRRKAAFMFEVEWTAMLGEILLRRHARIPSGSGLVRILAIAPERTELVRFKIERSPLLRKTIEETNWHIVKWNHLKTFLTADSIEFGALEPYLGLDPVIERSGSQLPLFDAPHQHASVARRNRLASCGRPWPGSHRRSSPT